jgi:hypothetical protein
LVNPLSVALVVGGEPVTVVGVGEIDATYGVMV